MPGSWYVESSRFSGVQPILGLDFKKMEGSKSPSFDFCLPRIWYKVPLFYWQEQQQHSESRTCMALSSFKTVLASSWNQGEVDPWNAIIFVQTK